jgi:Tfp pilus assembly protein PilN
MDFVRVQRPASVAGLALFAAGALTAGALALEARDAHEDLQDLLEQHRMAERRVRAAQRANAPVAPPAAQEARAMLEAQRVITRLNTPWPRLLADTAAAAGPAIALTGLNPDTQSRSVRIAGVADDMAAVYAFVERMQRLPGFVQVHLAQHAAGREAAGAAKVAFVVVAQWTGGT